MMKIALITFFAAAMTPLLARATPSDQQVGIDFITHAQPSGDFDQTKLQWESLSYGQQQAAIDYAPSIGKSGFLKDLDAGGSDRTPTPHLDSTASESDRLLSALSQIHNGKDGVDGTNGSNGKDGQQGKNGKNADDTKVNANTRNIEQLRKDVIIDSRARYQEQRAIFPESKAYTDQRIDSVQQQQNDDREEYRAGIAGVGAIAGLHYVDKPNAIALGAADFKDAQGYALGYRHKFTESAASTLSASGTSNGDAIVAVSASVGW